MSRRIFLTGASSGIGEALARLWAAEGTVLGMAARREDMLAALAAELRGRGARVHVYPVDVSDTAAMQDTASRFLDTEGGVELVLANAGMPSRHTILDGDAAMVARVLAVNIVGVTNTLVPFVPAMVAARRGTLAAVSSIAGFRPLPGRVAYSTSKAAVTHFMEGLRQDLHGTGVHAMAICPGYVRTPMTEGMKSMPFAVDVDEAARRIDHALARRGRLFTFPWQMSILRRILELAPEPTMRRLAPPPRRRP